MEKLKKLSSPAYYKKVVNALDNGNVQDAKSAIRSYNRTRYYKQTKDVSIKAALIRVAEAPLIAAPIRTTRSTTKRAAENKIAEIAATVKNSPVNDALVNTAKVDVQARKVIPVVDRNVMFNKLVSIVAERFGRAIESSFGKRVYVEEKDLKVLSETGNNINGFIREVISRIGRRSNAIITVISRRYTIDAMGRQIPIGRQERKAYTFHSLPKLQFDELKSVFTYIESDMDEEIYIRKIEKVAIDIMDTDNLKERIRKLEATPRARPIRKLKEGGFFPYYNNVEFGLEELQIYYSFKKENYDENCLIYAFRMAAEKKMISEQLFLDVKKSVKTRNVTKKKLKEIASFHNCYITLIEYNGVAKRRTTYGSKDAPNKMPLALYNSHYFLDFEMDITNFALNNMEMCETYYRSHIFNNVPSPYYYTERSIKKGCVTLKYDKKRFRKVDSIRVVDYLFRNGGFDKFSVSDFMKLGMEPPIVDEIIESETIKAKKVKYKEIKPKDYIIYGFDFEADASPELETHKEYCVSLQNIYNEDSIMSFVGPDCAERLLKYLRANHTNEENILLYAHNLGYDITFIMGVEGVSRVSRLIKRGNLVYRIFLRYKGLNLEFRDSYAHINGRLANFTRMFCTFEERKAYKKEIFPYNLYRYPITDGSVIKKIFTLEEARPHIPEEDFEQFKENVKEIDPENYKLGQFDSMRYAIYYCERDVKLLCLGLRSFNSQTMEAFGLRMWDYISIASLAHSYMKKRKVYKGVYQLGGAVRLFIEKCIHGGRVMTRKNEVIKSDIVQVDFDACSLYPSAMERLGAFPIGIPEKFSTADESAVTSSNKPFKSSDFAFWFARIEILKIKKHRSFPLIIEESKEDNVIKKTYKNISTETEGRPVYMYVDNIYAEDIVKYHEAEIKVIKGYGFRKVQEVHALRDAISECYNKRLELKAKGSLLQNTYKLLMNSSYGKTCQKHYATNIKVMKKGEETKRYITRNYNFIHSFTELGNEFLAIKRYEEMDTHFNEVHCGSLILSMSKRIMNEVMFTAEDMGINIYYQDTDSMHIAEDDVPKLAEEFKKKYDRELIGKKMGQFHSDFDPVPFGKGAYEYDTDRYKLVPEDASSGSIKVWPINTVSTSSYFLAKKVYIDKLKTTWKDEKNRTYEREGWHIRMKGVGSKAVMQYAKDVSSVEETISPMDVYKKLYNNESIDVDLCKTGPKFKKESISTITTLSEFIRKIKIDGERVEARSIIC